MSIRATISRGSWTEGEGHCFIVACRIVHPHGTEHRGAKFSSHREDDALSAARHWLSALIFALTPPDKEKEFDPDFPD